MPANIANNKKMVSSDLVTFIFPLSSSNFQCSNDNFEKNSNQWTHAAIGYQVDKQLQTKFIFVDFIEKKNIFSMQIKWMNYFSSSLMNAQSALANHMPITSRILVNANSIFKAGCSSEEVFIYQFQWILFLLQ